MNNSNRHYQTIVNMRARQRGMITTFTGVMVLVLLTLMMFFAIRVGVFEQRVSANDSRQKLAFHTAESGIHHAKEFLLANSLMIPSIKPDLLGNGSDGWLAETTEKRWQKCSDAGLDLINGHGDHPCFGEANSDQRAETYYYSFDSATGTTPTSDFEDFTELSLDTDAIIPGTTESVGVEALLCMLEIDKEAPIPVQGCSTDRSVADGSYFMVTILARGEADCTIVEGVPECNAEALVSEQGTAEVVPNPNAGGVGVPVSVWMNNNTEQNCSGGNSFDPSSGSWSTCEMHEWYGVDQKPDDMACSGTCSCTEAESISYTDANTHKPGIDLVVDDDFPCDLFQFYFGIERSSYEIVKGYSRIISDCDSLDENSSGIYWVSGSTCRVNSNTTIGSPDNPILLISAATTTTLNGGAKIYGVMFVTDVEDEFAELNSLGTNTVYGSVINDATLGSYQGTFQVVWAEDVSEKAGNGGGLGSVLGGWSDFHENWE